jgi:hypothetical protein
MVIADMNMDENIMKISKTRKEHIGKKNSMRNGESMKKKKEESERELR